MSDSFINMHTGIVHNILDLQPSNNNSAHNDHIIKLSRLFYIAEINVFQTVDLHRIKRKTITKTKSDSEVLRLGTHEDVVDFKREDNRNGTRSGSMA